MSARLADRLDHSRRRSFVGRRAELELFRRALERNPPDFAVLHLHGPGGVGKSTLLREYQRLAAGAGRACALVDCRHLDVSPLGFLTALQATLNLSPEQALPDALEAFPGLVLLVDTFELATPLDAWLREEFLPLLPEGALVVIAGREAPIAEWRGDHGWGALTRIVALRNLFPEEGAAFLRAQGVPDDEIDRVLSVTYNHPLALSLAADLYRQNRMTAAQDLRRDPDTVRVLLERFVADVPNPVMRQALELCAHAFVTDEELLCTCLGEEEGRTAFDWLRHLSFVEQGPFGLFPHDLAREVLEADLHWRNRARFREVHFQVRTPIIQRIRRSSGTAQQQAIFALLFLHRNNPFMRPFYAWQSIGRLYIDVARPSDFLAIEAMIARHQGETALAVTRYWRNDPRAVFYVFRATGQAIAGFCHVIETASITAADRAADPALDAAAVLLAGRHAGQPDEVILYFRNWMDAGDYQRSPAIFNMCAMVTLHYLFNTPTLAYSLIAQAFSDHYAGMFEYLRMTQAEAAAFVQDGQRFGAFLHDWRTEPVLAWMDIMGERELLDEMVALESLPLPVQTVALSEPEFADAVRQALRDLHRPDSLGRNPLLRARCLRDQGDATPAGLQALLRQAAQTLTATPRTLKLHRALWHTYFEPAATQEAVAELLDLPFSTYRYQLGKAVEQLTAHLWQQELYGDTPAAG